MKIDIVNYTKATFKKWRVLIKLYRQFFLHVRRKEWTEALNINKRKDRVKFTI